VAKRTSKKLIALSSVAILSVYAAGYALTAPAAANMAAAADALANAPSPTPAATPTPTLQPQAGNEGQGRQFRERNRAGAAGAPAAAPSPTPSSAPASQPAAAAASVVLLKDGSYAGSGMSRRGGVNVAVTIAGGKISTVKITAVTTHYPESLIDGLPTQVVARQSSQVNLVSGATESSRAFQQAVSQALSRARIA